MRRALREPERRVRALMAAGAAALVAVTACASSEPAATTSPVPLPSTSTVAVLAPTGSTTAPRPVPRVLLIGDSTLLAVSRYNAFRALQGFEYAYDAESCRTLGIPSCGESPVPPNAVEAIGAADGSFDSVVVMAGYDEWWTSFPESFDEVVAAARSKGARHVIWLTYPEGVPYKLLTGERADEAFIKNNQTLRDKIASGAFPDVQLARWYPHTSEQKDWITKDGIHLTRTGALGAADYISRWVAHVEALPCPMPRVPGGPVEAVCSNPDSEPPVADVSELYDS